MTGRAQRRVACVELPDLRLQMLLRDRPRWRGGPAAVVAEDRPDAPLTQLNDAARRRRLRAGMRYGVARDLVPSLRAGTVGDERVLAVSEELAGALATFSPRVEPDPQRPGVFFVDPSGMDRLYGGARSWAGAVHAYLRGRGLSARVLVGWGRFATFAVGRTRAGVTVLRDRAEQRELLSAVPLEQVGVSPALRDELALLDVRTLGDLVGLPADALHARFGEEASALHTQVCDDPQLPMQPRAPDEPVRVHLQIEPPDSDHARLLFAIKGALHELLGQVAARLRTVGALVVELELEARGGEPPRTVRHRIEPAAPTRDAMLLVDLVRLRLADQRLEAPVQALALEAEEATPSGEQLSLFQAARRDRRAGERALARVRAAFGEGSVTRARLRDAHLPEAGFRWEALDRLPAGHRRERPAPPSAPPLVRRVLSRPRALPARDRRDPSAGPDLGPGDRALLRLYGPYRVSGGWWVRTVERDYYYGETGHGDLLWLFYDRPKRRWFLHGTVD